MRAKSLILLVIALGCGMIAAVGVSKAVMDKGPAQQVEASVEIFVAVKDLQQGEKITAENVKLEKWPKNRVPEGATFNLEQVENWYTKNQLFAGEPILEKKIEETSNSFSTNVPKGYRIFDIAGGGGYIKPGDHVDILGTFKSGGRNSVSEIRTVMRNVKVHGINGSTLREAEEDEKGRASRTTTFQLLVKESQLEALTLAKALGTLQLNLRPFDEDENSDNGEEFLSWIKSSAPVDQEAAEVAEPTPTLTSTFGGMQQQPKAEPKNTLTIISGDSIKQYEWTKANELPREVNNQPAAPTGSQIPAFGQAGYGGYGSANGNVYSEYGGYQPTYPVSTSNGESTPDEEATKPTKVE